MYGNRLNLNWWRWPSLVRGWAWGGVLAGLLVAGAASTDAQADAAAGGVDQLRAVVQDAERSTEARTAAAMTLLDRDDVEPVDLLDTLLPLLADGAATTQREVAGRLAQRTSDGLIDALIARACDAEAALTIRQGAVRALGYQRVRRAAEVLVQLSAPAEEEPLRQAAFAALATLTDRDDLAADHAAWQRWWRAVAPLSPEQWQQHLLQSMARQRREARQHQHVLESRLVDAHRSLYRAAASDDRPAQLMRLLGDPLEVVRQLGIDLAVQRLVDDQPFEEPLRQSLRARLDDPSPAVRQRATLLLRDLADGPAADRVAHRLANAVEQEETVLRAELLMISRLPRIEAVERSLELLAHPALRDEAAGAINAAMDADRLTYQQGGRALQTVRKQLDAGRPPLPSIVLLLGRLGDEQDWQRIQRWLDAEDDAVKQAAARAWAASDRELLPLVERVDDARIESIALLAAARRGQSEATFRALVGFDSSDEPVRERWQRALEQMAGRVPAPVVLSAVRELQQREAEASLCQRLLDAALARAEAFPREGADREQAALLLARGRLWLAEGEPEAALADFDRLERMTAALSEAQREQRLRGVVHASLWLEQFDRAFEVARSMVQPVDAGDEPMTLSESDSPMDLLFEAADERAVAGDADALAQLVAGIRMLLPTPGTGSSQRIDLLEARLSQLRDTADRETSDEDTEATDGEADADDAGAA